MLGEWYSLRSQYVSPIRQYSGAATVAQLIIPVDRLSRSFQVSGHSSFPVIELFCRPGNSPAVIKFENGEAHKTAVALTRKQLVQKANNLEGCCARLIFNDSQLPGPSNFSLYTTFNKFKFNSLISNSLGRYSPFGNSSFGLTCWLLTKRGALMSVEYIHSWETG